MSSDGVRGPYKAKPISKDALAYGVCPPCVDQEAFNNWHRLNRLSGKDGKADAQEPGIGFCIDCNPCFQERNKQEGTCTNPDVVFVKGQDGCLRGTLNIENVEKKNRRKKYTRKPKISKRLDLKVKFVAAMSA